MLLSSSLSDAYLMCEDDGVLVLIEQHPALQLLCSSLTFQAFALQPLKIETALEGPESVFSADSTDKDWLVSSLNRRIDCCLKKVMLMSCY